MFCILILTSASTPFILGKSRMRKRARTDLCGGRPAMVVPTATAMQLHGGISPVKSALLRSTSGLPVNRPQYLLPIMHGHESRLSVAAGTRGRLAIHKRLVVI
jgi:hypothetical protein